jgi:V/A-type H+-transporting ATPase subunit C
LVDDFGYLNARIRARRSLLIPEGFFREALNLNLPELVEAVGEGIYGPDLTGESLADVDRAVTMHFSRTVGDLPRLLSGKAREAVELLLMRADLANIKTILRGRALGWSVDEIKGHLGGGTLPPGLYGTMAEAADAASLAQVISLPDHVLAAALRDAAKAGNEPVEVELSLDRSFYLSALEAARELDQPVLGIFLRYEIDALNLASGLKLFTLGIKEEPDRFFLRGGRSVTLSLFRRLADGEFASLQELSDTDFKGVAEVRDLLAMERSLRCILLEKAREGARDVLGIGLAIDYVQQKEWEGSRIRLLARRAYYNLPAALVEKEIFCQ